MNNTINKLILDRGSSEKLHKKITLPTLFSNSRYKYIMSYLFKIMFPRLAEISTLQSNPWNLKQVIKFTRTT